MLAVLTHIPTVACGQAGFGALWLLNPLLWFLRRLWRSNQRVFCPVAVRQRSHTDSIEGQYIVGAELDTEPQYTTLQQTIGPWRLR